jgi:Putative lumazine-binding
MTNDNQALVELNILIGDAENRGDVEWLSNILAPILAFRRADLQKTVDDKAAFLEKVKSGGNRETTVVEPIEIFGDRAIVKCIVKVGDQNFHNIRLFVRREGEWKLLGWANEAM